MGAGGSGVVYEAVREGKAPARGVTAPVAIKVIDEAWAHVPEVVARLEREAKAIASIDSPYVIRVLELAKDPAQGGRVYLVMEFLRGRDLGAVLAEQRTLPPARAAHIVRDVLTGLSAAHAAGVLHRDLKPENVVLEGEGTQRELGKLVDFGMSKLDPDLHGPGFDLTARGIVMGTPSYVSPEQARASGDLDARSDVYGAGALLFECLTGRPPHVGETHEQIFISVCTRDAPDVRAFAPQTPPALAAIVAKALARERDDRFASAEDMRRALAALSLPAAGKRGARSNAIVATLGVVAAVAGAAITLWLLR